MMVENNAGQQKDINDGSVKWRPTWKDYVLYLILGLLFIGQIVMCVLYYNWIGLDAVLYIGWAVLVISLLLGMMARVALQEKGGTEGKNWIQTKVVVDSGVYAVVRHPMYLSFIILDV
jgi:protein-S-isoprenylcysteine O-methyltransferase Ste14